ncbi:MAG: hypothetical protein KF830_03585 [Planctomycetes bacterium]|nr:hypothetical protein [Planctomycetota bacterium]
MQLALPRLPAAVAAGLLALAPVRAQALELDVTGGSMPGVLAIDAHPEAWPFDLMLVLPSGNTGPTPLAWIDPFDPRVLDVGIDLLDAMWVGLTGVDGHFRVNLPLVLLPSLVDTPLYVQAVNAYFAPNLTFHRVSNPNVVRFAPAAAFRDRLVASIEERAFATVLRRPDRRWMVCGGGRGLLLAQVAHQTTEIYDPWTDGFTYGPPMTVQRSLHTMTQLPGGRWLLAGGVGFNNDPQDSCEIYDPALDTFTACASMLSPRMGHTATLLPNGKVLVTGGLVALTVQPTQLSAVRDATNLTELYDPATDTWTAGPNLTTPRAAHAAVARPDGKVLLAGGISWDPVIIVGWLPAVRRSCDLYDPVANTMASAPMMANSRSMLEPLHLGNDRWLFAGGIGALTLTNLGTPTATAEIYDAAANTWTSVGSLATARGNHQAWALGNGTFLVAGGANGTILGPTPLATTEVFSPATNSFSAGPPLTNARAGAASLRTPQGQVQLFGGATAGGSITRSTEWYYF